MKTAEEILSSLLVEKVIDVNDRRTLLEFSEVIKAMKIYANAKLDEAAENARISFTDILYNSEVDKESILLFKDEI